jgi:hypothetical protein
MTSPQRPAGSEELLRMFLPDMMTTAILPGKPLANSTVVGQRSPMPLCIMSPEVVQVDEMFGVAPGPSTTLICPAMLYGQKTTTPTL